MGFNQAPALPYRNLGIVEDGNTASQAIEKDKYIIWKGGNYFAKTDILQGETFVVDTNLTAMPEGVINGIVDSLNASLMWKEVISNFNPNIGNTYQIPADCKELCFEIGWAQSNLHFSCILPITPDFQTVASKAIFYTQSGLGTGEIWFQLRGTTLTVTGKENIGYCSNLVYGR